MLAFDNILSLMKKIIILVLIFVSKNIFAESLEPKCKGNDDSKWTNCYGSISKNGTTYVGKFFNGMMHGKGTFTYSDGATYYGEFKNGEESGKGTFICWQHGAKYVGDFLNGKKHGTGTYNFPDGSNYVGNWKDGYRHGNGVYTFKNGKKKAGIFKKNKFIGDNNDG